MLYWIGVVGDLPDCSAGGFCLALLGGGKLPVAGANDRRFRQFGFCVARVHDRRGIVSRQGPLAVSPPTLVVLLLAYLVKYFALSTRPIAEGYAQPIHPLMRQPDFGS